MRLNTLLIVASTLLSTAFALPVVVSDSEDLLLSKRNPDFSDDSVPSLSLRFDIEFDEVIGRDTLELFERAKGPKVNPPKITFGTQARKDLDDLGLHGKDRKQAKKYHKNIIKDHMKTVPGAHTADVARIGHTGGTTPNDPFHATVAYRKKPPTLAPGQKLSKTQQGKLKIPSTYKDATGATKSGGLHHVYPKASTKMPPAYAAAERKRTGLAPGAPIPHKH